MIQSTLFPWLQARTFLYVVHGSRAYGTSRPTSDYDYKGVAVPPKAYRDGFLKNFEQAEIKEPDTVIYDVRKFFRLATENNPNIIEVMWVEPEDRLICTVAGLKLIAARELFLSQKVLHTFRGYAVSQLHRIKGHRAYLLNPPKGMPTRQAFGLPERTVIPADQLAAAKSSITKKMDSWEIDFGSMEEASKIYVQEQISRHLVDLKIGNDEKFMAAGRLLGFTDNFLELLDRERRYEGAKKQWQQYQEWKKNRNEARAALEAAYGLDTKHSMHLVRLLKMCREILVEGVVRVRRPDAKELLAIRNGAWTYEQLIAWAEQQEQELAELAQKSSLPKTPDQEKLDQLCIEITQTVERENA